MLSGDTHRVIGEYSFLKFLKLYARNRSFRPLVPIRLYQRLRGSALGQMAYPILWLWHRRATRRAGMEMPLRTDIGPAFHISHGFGVIINEHARIGANCTIMHGATLGRADRLDGESRTIGGCPMIEDDVWIGPHAIIVGAVTIGAGSRILGGAVVTSDIPPRSMVAGNPGAVIKSNCARDVLNPTPIDTKYRRTHRPSALAHQ
ncbi:MAG TPA: serine acetyltransferase [Acetobacteraceae bacterium]|nr:serine acetyltransferase [Acetobacteraceae bacterium]